MSNIVHDKYHRQNHHSFMTPTVTDMGLDPIASKELPFSGEFVMDNADHDTWLLSSDRVAFEWVSGYNDVDSLKFDVGISGTNGKTITYPSGNFGNVVIVNGNTDAPALSVVGKSIFTDDIIHDGNLKVSSIDTTSISADTVLISGSNGFALNVTNGSSKFNDVIGGDFTITGNTGVTGDIVVGGNAKVDGDLNVNENLYFTSGIATGGFLNVAGSAFFGDVKVSGKIEADDYYYKRTTGINVPSDGGWLLSGDISDAQKELIPGKDAGAVTYDPGINNMTLSAIGLSSDSWASFGGNLLIHGDKFYVDADETTFSNPVYFSSTTAQHLSSNEFSAYNAYIEHVCGNVQVDSLNSENIFGESAYFDGVTGNIISGDMLSADDAFVNSLTTNTLTSDTLSAETALFDIVSATHVSGTYVVAESGFYLNENPIIIPNENQPDNISVSATSLAASNDITLGQTPNRFALPLLLTPEKINNYAYDTPDKAKNLVMNIDYGNKNFVDLQWAALRDVRHKQWAESTDTITEYLIMYGSPRHVPAPGQNEHLHWNPTWQQWYMQASTRIYYTRIGISGQKKMRVICQLPDLFLKHSRTIEISFTFLCFMGSTGNPWDIFVFQALDANGNSLAKYLGLNQMLTPEGNSCTLSWMRGGLSGNINGLFRIRVSLAHYAYIECLGRGNNFSIL